MLTEVQTHISYMHAFKQTYKNKQILAYISDNTTTHRPIYLQHERMGSS